MKNFRLRKIRDWYRTIKAKHSCKACGEKDIRCLDFHHRLPRRKRNTISAMVSKGYSKIEIRKEMKKCDVLCSNCHRKHHYGVNQLSLRRKSILEKIVISIKNESSCLLCGEASPCCLDFHHTNPEDKTYNIGDAIRSNIDVTQLILEINKCQIICSNCHRKFHFSLT